MSYEYQRRLRWNRENLIKKFLNDMLIEIRLSLILRLKS